MTQGQKPMLKAIEWISPEKKNDLTNALCPVQPRQVGGENASSSSVALEEGSNLEVDAEIRSPNRRRPSSRSRKQTIFYKAKYFFLLITRLGTS